MEDKVLNIGTPIDQLEVVMRKYPPKDCPLNHRFLPGFYIREILMPAETLVTSQIHLTTHPFFVLQGKVSVINEDTGEEILIQSPYSGTTYPNTRRVLYIHENCVWITVHRTEIQPEDDSPESIAKAVALIEDEILDKRENPLIGGRIKNNTLLQSIDNHVVCSR